MLFSKPHPKPSPKERALSEVVFLEVPIRDSSEDTKTKSPVYAGLFV
jgi:hypothetical protein